MRWFISILLLCWFSGCASLFVATPDVDSDVDVEDCSDEEECE